MVTIKDIARESGYSISTVSRVLNHRNDVSPDAKKKIEEVVEKFHFVPNNNAKHLKQSNTKTIVSQRYFQYVVLQHCGGDPADDRKNRLYTGCFLH